MLWIRGRRVALAVAAVLVAAGTMRGQAFHRDVIVLDAAHGGSESGAALATDVEEKDVTLAFAVRLRSLLAARGFTVVLTRSGDVALSADQRAEAANRARAVACVVIHATASGVGVHLATSAMRPGNEDTVSAVAWDRAQVAYVDQSQRLANALGGAVVRSHLPVVVDRAALRPLDNLSCPAVAVELAPSPASGSDAAGADDDDYQQQVAKAIAGALVLWRNQAEPPPSVVVRPSRLDSPEGLAEPKRSVAPSVTQKVVPAPAASPVPARTPVTAPAATPASAPASVPSGGKP